MAHEAGKGDTPRPTDHEAFAEGYYRIFGHKGPLKAAKVTVPEAIDMLGKSRQIQVGEGSHLLNAANDEPEPDSAA